MKKNIFIFKNKKLKFKYKILNKFIAGLNLFKDEIKFIRSKNININNSYCIIYNNEIFINNFYIIKHNNNIKNKYFKKRNIKLLLNRNEILKISKKIKVNNYSLLPYKIYLKNNNLAKIIICICKIYKKKYNKNKKKNNNYINDFY
ncbi:MAG: SsrA-binding protein [Candidatus Shikimatogenerans sp. Tder]|uniref:SsrA-binding protein n=1 Tax=Candidatus Shikimatogenerans sp. Tder TaxID=3158566 RepID=A0AAU7QS11_9FLAO